MKELFVEVVKNLKEILKTGFKETILLFKILKKSK